MELSFALKLMATGAVNLVVCWFFWFVAWSFDFFSEINRSQSVLSTLLVSRYFKLYVFSSVVCLYVGIHLGIWS